MITELNNQIERMKSRIKELELSTNGWIEERNDLA